MSEAIIKLCRALARQAVRRAASGCLVLAYDTLTASLHHAEATGQEEVAAFWQRELQAFEAAYVAKGLPDLSSVER